MKAPKSNPALVVLGVVLDHLQSAGAALTGSFSSLKEPTASFKWNGSIPRLARAIADMIDLDPGQFAWLSFSAQGIRGLETELQRLLDIRSFLDGLAGQIDQMIAARKGELVRMTSETTTGLKGILASPLTPDSKRQRLAYLSQAVQTVLDEHYGAIRERRLQNQSLLARGEAGTTPADGSTSALAPRRSRRARKARR